MKLKCKWERDYDGISAVYASLMPVCPSCEEPLYETDRCVFCGQEIDQNDEKLQKWLEPPEIKTEACHWCGGTIEYIESKYNGHRHGKCRDCGLRIME